MCVFVCSGGKIIVRSGSTSANVIGSDVMAGNAVVHVIDNVSVCEACVWCRHSHTHVYHACTTYVYGHSTLASVFGHVWYRDDDSVMLVAASAFVAMHVSLLRPSFLAGACPRLTHSHTARPPAPPPDTHTHTYKQVYECM